MLLINTTSNKNEKCLFQHWLLELLNESHVSTIASEVILVAFKDKETVQ